MQPNSDGQQDRATYLSIRGLWKRFGSFVALRDIDLDVQEGELVCFLGPSGCGKTTLLRAIAGLTAQCEGRIIQAGSDISDLPVTERDFGIVFQSYALFPNLSVARNVGYGLWAEKKLTSADKTERVKALLDLVGLPDSGDKFPNQLSGGQQQRVALARALATSPGLLLLDEPLSALDARVRQRLRLEIKQLQRRVGVTTIMVTHDQEEALTMADRIVVMSQGAIEQVGTPLEIYGFPASPFVADFVGIMNVLPGEVCEGERIRVGGTILEAGGALNGFVGGDQVTVCMRPEDVVLADRVEDAGSNTYAGRVRELEFLGSIYRAFVEVPERGGLLVAVSLPIRFVRERDIRVDSALSIALPKERLRIFGKATGAGPH